MNRKICIVTGTRAEFGLLRWLAHNVMKSDKLELQIIATGMHLSPEHGNTYLEIEAAGLNIDAKVEMLLSSDTSSAVSKAMGLAMIGFSDALERLSPDLIVVLGDRFEIFAAVSTALIARIPVAHLHGGETTEGAFDEALRHSITKMSQLHFVAAEDYRKRVIQLGEHPDRVFTVGGLGVDAMLNVKLLDRKKLEEILDFQFGRKNLLVTFHPATLDSADSEEQFASLLEALQSLEDTKLIFTLSNADNGGRRINSMIHQFVNEHHNSRAFASLGQERFLSCLQFVDAVIGNSSSGLAEAPSFGIGTINIGDRQKGRLRSSSILDCEVNTLAIKKAISVLYSAEFQKVLENAKNPYGDGGASTRIARLIEDYPLENIQRKTFYDIEGPSILGKQ